MAIEEKTTYTMTCDDCGIKLEGRYRDTEFSSERDADGEAEYMGWEIDGRSNLCPDCKPAEDEE